MLRRILTVLIGVAAAFVLASCRVDVTVEVDMKLDGSGVVSVTAIADAEVVAAAPGLAEDLRTDDLVAAGWELDGPAETQDGGLRVVIERPFASPAEATAILATLNGTSGPFQEVRLARVESEATVTFTLDGAGRVDAGLAVFADPDLLAAVGATPYAADIAAAELSPSQAVGLTFLASLPGTIDSTTSTVTSGPLEWAIPLDGTSVPFASTATRDLTDGGVWSIVADVAFAVFVVWIVIAVVFIAYVIYARRGRQGPGPRRDTLRRSPADRYDDAL